MSRKTELVKIFVEYKGRYEVIQSQVSEIQKSVTYTEEGKQQAIQQIVDSFAPTVQLYHDKAVELINGGLDALAEEWKKSSVGKLLDGGYQAGLANVIKMLELGAIHEKDDIKNIIETYTGDFNALAVIKNMLLQSKDEILVECAAMIPEDNREKNKNLLHQLRGNVDNYINISAVQGLIKSCDPFNLGVNSVCLGIDGLIQFITDRLGNGLELLN